MASHFLRYLAIGWALLVLAAGCAWGAGRENPVATPTPTAAVGAGLSPLKSEQAAQELEGMLSELEASLNPPELPEELP